MHMLYNSDSFAVLEIDAAELASGAPAGEPSDSGPSGYEIVDKAARKGIFIDGELARGFRARAQALVQEEADEDTLEAFVATYAGLAQQPMALH
ncbi:MAG TPA: DUF3567 family protein [Ideonella sp.]|uniref:BTH_I0359 family protein n=1 Tax=Ideonella sp. TaxID=1929293 RepID=UPI002BE10646|nr:DUF3567 family protein [Ideonella sp.]HSI46738.1 DUF3567 family protein [Ideonella sp.]